MFVCVLDNNLLTNRYPHVMPELYEFVRKPPKPKFGHSTYKHYFTNAVKWFNLLNYILLINQPLYPTIYPYDVIDIFLGSFAIGRDLAQVYTQTVSGKSGKNRELQSANYCKR
jgi:hypothetical protein